MSNFLFSILDYQGNPCKGTSLLELVLKGHHAGERCVLRLTLCTPEYYSSKRDAIPPIRNPCGLERGHGGSEQAVRGVRRFAPNHLQMGWRYFLREVAPPPLPRA